MLKKMSDEIGEKIAIVIDDTLLVKDSRSKKLALGGKKGRHCGFSLLTIVLVIGHFTIPLIPRLCFRKAVCDQWSIDYQAKTLKAEQMLENVIDLGLPPEKMILVVDSWYASIRMLQLCQSIKGLNYVLGIKSNRQVDGHRLNHLRFGVRYKKAKKLSCKGFIFYLSLRAGNLNGVKGNIGIDKLSIKPFDIHHTRIR